MPIHWDLFYGRNMSADLEPDRPATQDLRRRRAEVSRQAIREAVAALLLEDHPANLSVPAVAARAGVSVRTVYRYFPTKQDLLDDVAEVEQRRADAMVDGRQDMFERPDQYLHALWSDFENNVEAIRAQHLSPLGADLRALRLQKLKAEVQIRLEKSFPDADPDDRRDLGDLVMMVTSSTAFLELHDRMGHSGPDAARIAWWAAEALQRQFDAQGGFGEQAPDASTSEPNRTSEPTTEERS